MAAEGGGQESLPVLPLQLPSDEALSLAKQQTERKLRALVHRAEAAVVTAASERTRAKLSAKRADEAEAKAGALQRRLEEARTLGLASVSRRLDTLESEVRLLKAAAPVRQPLSASPATPPARAPPRRAPGRTMAPSRGLAARHRAPAASCMARGVSNPVTVPSEQLRDGKAFGARTSGLQPSGSTAESTTQRAVSGGSLAALALPEPAAAAARRALQEALRHRDEAAELAHAASVHAQLLREQGSVARSHS